MLTELKVLYGGLEERKQLLLERIRSLTEAQLNFRPGQDRWTVLQILQHMVIAERGMRLSEKELRDNPLRTLLKPGKLVDVVRGVLEKDIPVDVPHASLNPDEKPHLDEIVALWEKERPALRELLESIKREAIDHVMFSHPAAGPITAVQMLGLAIAHFDTHERAIDRLIVEMP
jgi:hypothetical protein